MILGAVAYDQDNPDQLPEVMLVPDEFYLIIGRVVARWATMELEAELLTTALLAKAGEAAPRATIGRWNKRWELLILQFHKFANGDAALIKEIKEVDRLAKIAKPIRDGLAHRRMMFGWEDNGQQLTVRFEIDNAKFPWSKAYKLIDIDKASLALRDAGGRLYRLNEPENPTWSDVPGMSRMRELPNMAHLRGALRKKRS